MKIIISENIGLTCFNTGPKSTYSGLVFSSKAIIGSRGTASIFVFVLNVTKRQTQIRNVIRASAQDHVKMI